MTTVHRAVRLERLGLISWAATQLPEPEDWTGSALCAQSDPEAFFPEKGGSTKEAKRICQGCEVRADCLAYALQHGERHGIWGGKSEQERRKIKPANRARILKGDRDDEVLRLNAQGWEPVAVASAMGVTERTIFRILAAARKREPAFTDGWLEESA